MAHVAREGVARLGAAVRVLDVTRRRVALLLQDVAPVLGARVLEPHLLRWTKAAITTTGLIVNDIFSIKHVPCRRGARLHARKSMDMNL